MSEYRSYSKSHDGFRCIKGNILVVLVVVTNYYDYYVFLNTYSSKSLTSDTQFYKNRPRL